MPNGKRKNNAAALLTGAAATWSDIRLLEQRIKRAGKFVELQRAQLHLATIQKVGRRPLNSLASRLGHVRLDDGRGLVAVETLVEISRSKLQIRRVLFQLGLGEGSDVFACPYGEQLVVIFPELALEIGAFSRLRRPVRFSDTTLIDDRVELVSELDLA